MTQNEIIRMAREAGFTGCLLPEEADNLIGGVFINDENWAKPLERFAALVAEATKDKATKVCEGIGWGNNPYVNPKAGTTCAAAIRSMK